jgi:hypothetical protein
MNRSIGTTDVHLAAWLVSGNENQKYGMIHDYGRNTQTKMTNEHVYNTLSY